MAQSAGEGRGGGGRGGDAGAGFEPTPEPLLYALWTSSTCAAHKRRGYQKTCHRSPYTRRRTIRPRVVVQTQLSFRSSSGIAVCQGCEL